MNSESFDVIIVGAGPAGCACALALRGTGLRIALVDKSDFPRDKVCGDAMSPDVIDQMRQLVPDFDYDNGSQGVQMRGVRLYSTNQDCLEVSIESLLGENKGTTMRRIDFDNQLVGRVREMEQVEFLPNMRVKEIQQLPNGVRFTLPNRVLESRMVLGADGAQSIVARKLGKHKLNRKHHIPAVRAYYQNVSGISADEGIIEFHLFKGLLPGYFWIFPLSKNEANVGLGLQPMNGRRINLRDQLDQLVQNHPALTSRFKQASRIGAVTGFGIPLGTQRRNISGSNFLLAGDAAGIVDPLTGEGIGNAIRSGRFAANQIGKCFETKDFSAEFNRNYDQHLYKKIGRELLVSRMFRPVIASPFLANLLIRGLSRSLAFQKRFYRFLMRVVSTH